MVRDLIKAPIFRVIVAWHIVWGAIALLTDAAPFISFMNGLVLSVAIGIVVAYFGVLKKALTRGTYTTGDLLSVGIWLSWWSIIEQRGFSILWRYMGTPQWLLNTDYATHFLSLTMLAGLFHLAGPEAIDGLVPTRQWIRIGLIVGSGALLTTLMIFLADQSLFAER